MNNTSNINTYASKIAMQLSGIFDKDSPNFIDSKELEDPIIFQQFIYALSCLVPCSVYNTATTQEIDLLRFSHLTNSLIFEYASLEKDTEPTLA